MKRLGVLASILAVAFTISAFSVDPDSDENSKPRPYLSFAKRNYKVDESKLENAKRIRRQFLGTFGTLLPNIPSASASQAGAQAQAFNVKGPLGGFGASASGAQSQSVGFSPAGLSNSAGFSGTQQYILPNGQVIDVAFGNTFGSANGNAATAGSSVVTITGADGSV